MQPSTEPSALVRSNIGHSSRLFETTDLDSCREHVGRIFKPHELNTTLGHATLRARMDHLQFGALSINRLAYGADVTINPGPLESFYLLQIPLAGHAQVNTGSRQFLSSPAAASMLSPQPDLAMRWSADCDQLIVRFDPVRFEQCARQRLANNGPVSRVDPRLPIGRNSLLLSTLRHVLTLYGQYGAALNNPLFTAPVEDLLVTQILAAQPGADHVLTDGAGGPGTQTVNDVVGYMLAHPALAHSSTSLALHAGISVRSLFSSFARHRGCGPMTILRQIRLDQVNQELRRPGPATDVTSTALRWGFGHLGRFSQQYRERLVKVLRGHCVPIGDKPVNDSALARQSESNRQRGVNGGEQDFGGRSVRACRLCGDTSFPVAARLVCSRGIQAAPGWTGRRRDHFG